jgi:ABC-type spermidine/putrescine transport system permease subunit II
MDSILYCLFLTFILTMYYVPVILLFPYSFDPHLLGLVSTPGDT